MDPGAYCRDVESYLCRKNDGHLIRIVGPAFGMVCGWAERDIPLRLVFAGIDRTFERYYAKPGRRRPVRIEFCEADVLERFDEWRRAVGVRGDDGGGAAGGGRSPARRTLPTHLADVAARLSAWMEGEREPPGLAEAVASAVRDIESMRGSAAPARGAARRDLMDGLASVERALAIALREAVDPTRRDALRNEAMRDLEPFRSRMTPATFQEAVEAGTDRLLWQHAKLPRVAFE